MTDDQKTESLKHTTFALSAARLASLRNNRQLDNIPINDAYWLALTVHRMLYNTK